MFTPRIFAAPSNVTDEAEKGFGHDRSGS